MGRPTIVVSNSTTPVDVVIPTMGRWDRVADALDSIETQTVGTRPIVVNDSGAAVPAVIAERCIVVSTGGTTGEGNARAVGLERVESRWVAFCDDDDRWAADKLQRQFEALGDDGKWCLTGATRVDQDDNILAPWSLKNAIELQHRGQLYRRMLTHNPIPAGPSSILVDTSFLRSAGGWEPQLRYFADWECWIRLQAEAPPTLLDEPLVFYRVWDGQMIGAREAGWQALDFIRKRHADERRRHNVGPLDDRVIFWILAGELRRPGHRWRALAAAAPRLRPTERTDVRVLGDYISESLAKRTRNR